MMVDTGRTQSTVTGRGGVQGQEYRSKQTKKRYTRGMHGTNGYGARKDTEPTRYASEWASSSATQSPAPLHALPFLLLSLLTFSWY